MAIASATLDKTRIKPSNSKVRFFKKFVTLSKKFVFITNRLRTFYHFYESVKNFNMNKVLDEYSKMRNFTSILLL